MLETDRIGNGAVRGVCSGRAGRRDGRVGTEQNESPETPTGSDGRGHLHDSDGPKTLKTILAIFGSSMGKNDPPDPVSNVGTRRGMAPARGRNNRHRIERQASSRTAHGVWTKATGESGARQFWAMAALLLGTHLAYDGGWNRIPQPWDVVELFSTDAHVSLAVSSAGGRATQLYDGGLGNSLRILAARQQLFEDVRGLPPRLDTRTV